jgi:uncharacterized membrane protein
MNQMIAAVFDGEKAALEGLRELRNMHSECALSLYASAVIVKNKAGQVSVKQDADQGPVGAVTGILAGALVGVLGGPAAVPLGGYIGGLAGLLFDLGKFGIDLAFFDEVSKALSAGKAAVLAEIEESWASLLDERMHRHGGTVYRRFRADLADDQLIHQGAALVANLNALREDLKRSIAEDRAAIQRDIERVNKQISATQDQAKSRLAQAKSEMNARMSALQDQAKNASGHAKERIDKRIADARSDFDMRSKKLNQALNLGKEALAA